MASNIPKITRNRNLNFSLQLCCAFAPFLVIKSVIAENAADVNEVIVTASKRNQTLKDFAGSVSVIKGDGLNPNASMSDIAQQVPGLTLINNGPRSITAITIRGLRMDDLTPNDFGGDGGTVATYVDNIPLQGYFIPPGIGIKDLQQVEVLRGPQGTLYGNASIGGLIRYVTAKPDLTKNTVAIGAVVSQTAESDDLNYDTDLVVNAPLIENVLGARILLSKQSNAGFIDNNSLLTGAQKDTNSDETQQIRASVLWKPANEFSLNASYSYQKINADDRQASNKLVTGDEYTSSSYYLEPMEGELKLSSVDATYDFGWATLTASVNRYDYTNTSVADLTDYLLHNYGEGYYAEYDKFSAYRSGDVDVVKDSGEIRLVSPNDQKLRWLMGAFMSTDDLDVYIADRVPGFSSVFGEDRPDNLDYIFTQAETLKELSFYTEVTYDLASNWDITLGARHFNYKDKLKTCSLLFPPSEPYQGNNYPLNCTSADNDDRSGTLGKFSSKLKLNEHQNIYYTLAQGFRRGGANVLPVEITEHRTYKPDTVLNSELGTHSDFLNGKLQFNAALFYMNWKKIQVASIVENQLATVNAGAARSKGVELETISQLNQQWNVRLSYSYTDVTITETVESINGGIEAANDGDRLPGSPKNQWNLGLNYQQPISSAILSAGISYSYSSDITTALNSGFENYTHLDGYSILNAQANLAFDKWQLGVFVNNATNAIAITSKRTAALYGEHGQFDYISRPRTIGLSTKYQF